ncbi:MAG: hypothetical protein ACK5UI_09480, partial [Bacteroidota bacterium]
MRNFLLIISLIANLLPLILYSQKNCTGYEELNRKRHKIDGGTYGHPYTTFDTKNGRSFEQTIKQIRMIIIRERVNEPIRG